MLIESGDDTNNNMMTRMEGCREGRVWRYPQVNSITAIVNFHMDSYAARVQNFNSIRDRGNFN